MCFQCCVQVVLVIGSDGMRRVQVVLVVIVVECSTGVLHWHVQVVLVIGSGSMSHWCVQVVLVIDSGGMFHWCVQVVLVIGSGGMFHWCVLVVLVVTVVECSTGVLPVLCTGGAGDW